MKMIIAIIRDIDGENVIRALTDAEFRVTCIASTGGFFDAEIAPFSSVWKKSMLTWLCELSTTSCSSIVEPQTHRATIFVLNVSQHVRF